MPSCLATETKPQNPQYNYMRHTTRTEGGFFFFPSTQYRSLSFTTEGVVQFEGKPRNVPCVCLGVRGKTGRKKRRKLQELLHMGNHNTGARRREGGGCRG